jgi:hypothetical protein
MEKAQRPRPKRPRSSPEQQADAGAGAAGADAEPETVVLTKPKLCVVCMDAPCDVLLTACGHFILCDGCAASLLARKAPCPTCRTPVRAVGGTRCIEPAPLRTAVRAADVASFQPGAVDRVARARALPPS